MHRSSTAKLPLRGHLSRRLPIAALAVCIGALTACGSGTGSDGVGSSDDAPVVTESGSEQAPDGGAEDGAIDPSSDPSSDAGSGDDPADDDPVANAPVLVPSATFAIENPDQVSSVAMSPDGTQVAVVTQPALGEPVTITLYDSTSGDVVNNTQADVIGLSIVQWMSDNRLVAYADRESEPVWRSWDGSTLAELPSVPLDFSCYTGQADRNTGVVYASDGLTGVGDDLCRVDTADGTVVRTAEGVLVDPEEFWLDPGSGGVVVTHYPDGDGPKQLVTLDGASLTSQSAVVIEEGGVRAVGLTTWLSPFDGPERLEPGGFVVPPRLSPDASDAGTVFLSANGTDDFVFVSALDGTVIGTMPAGLNPGFASDWSIDDSSFVRLTLDGQAEIYQF